jgi:hypothetical protein
MPCDECTALGKQLDDALDIYHEAVSAMRSESASKQEIAAKEARCRSARNALATHKQVCHESPQ